MACSAVLSCSVSWFFWWYDVSRRLVASAERTRSTARRCAMVISHDRGEPRAGSNRADCRQISTIASWVTSSA